MNTKKIFYCLIEKHFAQSKAIQKCARVKKIQVLRIPEGILVNRNFSKAVFIESVRLKYYFIRDPPIQGDLIKSLVSITMK